jgi:hypothetical protein
VGDVLTGGTEVEDPVEARLPDGAQEGGAQRGAATLLWAGVRAGKQGTLSVSILTRPEGRSGFAPIRLEGAGLQELAVSGRVYDGLQDGRQGQPGFLALPEGMLRQGVQTDLRGTQRIA